jgi:hypothetical protein
MPMLDGQMQRRVSFIVHGVQQDSEPVISANESNHIILIMFNSTMQKVSALDI